MTDIIFPITLPLAESGTLEEATTDPWVQDQSEVGASRRRKRFTRALHRFTFSLRLTSLQKLVLLAFYDDTLDDGVLAFRWAHPDTGTVYEARFVGRPPVRHVAADFWDANISIEEI